MDTATRSRGDMERVYLSLNKRDGERLSMPELYPGFEGDPGTVGIKEMERDYLCLNYILDLKEIREQWESTPEFVFEFQDDNDPAKLHKVRFNADPVLQTLMSETVTYFSAQEVGQGRWLRSIQILEEVAAHIHNFKLSTAIDFFTYLFGGTVMFQTYEAVLQFHDLVRSFQLQSMCDQMVSACLYTGPLPDSKTKMFRPIHRICRFMCAILPHREIDKIRCGTAFDICFGVPFRLDTQKQCYEISCIEDSERGIFVGRAVSGVDSIPSHIEFSLFEPPRCPQRLTIPADIPSSISYFMLYFCTLTQNCFHYHEAHGNILARREDLFNVEFVNEEEKGDTDDYDTEDQEHDNTMLGFFICDYERIPKPHFACNVKDMKKKIKESQKRKKQLQRKREARKRREIANSKRIKGEEESRRALSPVSSRTRSSLELREFIRQCEAREREEASHQSSCNEIQNPWFEIVKMDPAEVRVHVLPQEGRLHDLEAAVVDARDGSTLKHKVRRIKPPRLPHLFHPLGFNDGAEFVSLQSFTTTGHPWGRPMLKFLKKLGDQVRFADASGGFLLECGYMDIGRVMGTVRTVCVDPLVEAHYIFEPSYESMLRVVKGLFGPSETFKERDDMLTSDFTLIEVSLLWRAHTSSHIGACTCYMPLS